MTILRRGCLLGWALAIACGPATEVDTDGATSSDSGPPPATTTTAGATTSTPGTTTGTPPDGTSSDGDTTAAIGTSESSGSSEGSSSEGGSSESSTGDLPDCAPACPTHTLDVVFVIDNSGSMAQDQRKLALALPVFMAQVDSLQNARGLLLDLNVMFTTSDFGNPLCTPFEPPGYEPAQGAPIATACNARIADFDGLTPGSEFPEACTDVCPADVEPDDAWIHVTGNDDNVAGGTALEAMQCLMPQGNVGCGYEAPLENMLQALDPGAVWNAGGAGFLRDGADLAIVLLTDEMDCSVLDYAIMTDESLMNVNPNLGSPLASSAICWNAGVTCDGPDGSGIYSNCEPALGLGLQPPSRYTDYLVGQLVNVENKEVMMLAITGVPSVTEHAADPPYEPTAGGVFDLVFHTWVDGEYPVGDVTSDEWAAGLTAADKEFALGVGPGCTGSDGVGGWSQGTPPSRMRAVCEALDAQGSPHCCMESVCDDDYDAAMTCLRGMIETAL